jgi:hypothetical protein
VWSGDITSSFSVLREQVSKGLNMMITYPYWNSDTGGFGGGDWQAMGELVVRWFQFSIFTSIVRLHGTRTPREPQQVPLGEQCDPTGAAGGPVEPWVYGDGSGRHGTALEGIKQALAIRQSLLPYLKAQVALLASHGQPVMRPLWFDFPDDASALTVADQLMWGPSYMVAPVLDALPAGGEALQRLVVFPGDASVSFTDHFTGKVYKGGTQKNISVTTTEYFPFFSIERQQLVQAANALPLAVSPCAGLKNQTVCEGVAPHICAFDTWIDTCCLKNVSHPSPLGGTDCPCTDPCCAHEYSEQGISAIAKKAYLSATAICQARGGHQFCFPDASDPDGVSCCDPQGDEPTGAMPTWLCKRLSAKSA